MPNKLAYKLAYLVVQLKKEMQNDDSILSSRFKLWENSPHSTVFDRAAIVTNKGKANLKSNSEQQRTKAMQIECGINIV